MSVRKEFFISQLEFLRDASEEWKKGVPGAAQAWRCVIPTLVCGESVKSDPIATFVGMSDEKWNEFHEKWRTSNSEAHKKARQAMAMVATPGKVKQWVQEVSNIHKEQARIMIALHYTISQPNCSPETKIELSNWIDRLWDCPAEPKKWQVLQKQLKNKQILWLVEEVWKNPAFGAWRSLIPLEESSSAPKKE